MTSHKRANSFLLLECLYCFLDKPRTGHFPDLLFSVRTIFLRRASYGYLATNFSLRPRGSADARSTLEFFSIMISYFTELFVLKWMESNPFCIYITRQIFACTNDLFSASFTVFRVYFLLQSHKDEVMTLRPET